MPNLDLAEKRFEHDIEAFMLENGYEQFSYQDERNYWIYKEHYDPSKCLYLDVLVDFISKTQPREWNTYLKYHGAQAKEKLYKWFDTEVNTHGLIHVLRNGITDMGVKLKVCYFKPESKLNEKDNAPEMFVKSLFPNKFKDIVTRCFLENNDIFKKLFNDSDFYVKVMEAMAKELYKELRSEDK